MVNQITAAVVTIGEREPMVLSLLKKDGKATQCNTSSDICDHYRNDAQETNLNQTTVGYCRLTCITCLYMARTIADKLP